jgi:hypothetical protein
MINKTFIAASLLTCLGVSATAQTVTSPTAPLVPRVDCTLPANAALAQCLNLPAEVTGVTNYGFIVGPLAGVGAAVGLLGLASTSSTTTTTTN